MSEAQDDVEVADGNDCVDMASDDDESAEPDVIAKGAALGNTCHWRVWRCLDNDRHVPLVHIVGGRQAQGNCHRG